MLRRLPTKNESGQVLVMTALMLAVVIGAVGLAVDVGLIMHTRTDLQKDVDAMALAGAAALCGTVSCETTADGDARTYGTRNGVTGSDTTTIAFGVDCDGATSANHDMITVRVERYQQSYFSRVIGFDGGDIAACATARKFALGGISGVRPFGLEDNCIAGINYGETVVLKFDSDTTRVCDALAGNFGTIDIDGGGGRTYEDTIKYGSIDPICAEGVAGCTTYLFATETGNMVGPTKGGVKYLFDNTPEACDTWAEVITDDGNIEPACNPWRPGYSALGTRLIVVPVVDGMWDSGGNNTIVIKKFAIVFLESYANGNCTGNSCDLNARFIKTELSVPGAKRTTFSPNADATVIALVK